MQATTNPFKQEMVKMQFPQGMGTSLSIAGFSLEADEDNCVTVPEKHVQDLEAHGLTRFVASPKPATITPKK